MIDLKSKISGIFKNMQDSFSHNRKPVIIIVCALIFILILSLLLIIFSQKKDGALHSETKKAALSSKNSDFNPFTFRLFSFRGNSVKYGKKKRLTIGMSLLRKRIWRNCINRIKKLPIKYWRRLHEIVNTFYINIIFDFYLF